MTASGVGWNTGTQSEVVSDSLATQMNFYLTPAAGGAPCALNPSSLSVTICTPANNATVTSPVNVVAGTTDSRPVSFVQAYLDGNAVVTQNGGSLNASIPMSQGLHRLTVQAKDTSAVIFKQTINVTAGSAVPTPTPSPIPTPTPAPTPSSCTAGGVSPSVTICSPVNNATVSSPVRVTAATKDSVAVSFLQIYVDGIAILTRNGSTLDSTGAIAKGVRRVTVQAKDSKGVIFKQTISITVR